MRIDRIYNFTGVVLAVLQKTRERLFLDFACVWEAYLEAKDSPPPLVLHTVCVNRQDHSITAYRANH